MIEDYTLEKICNEYGIDYKKVIKNNQNILTYGEYFDIKMVLEYLINEIEVTVKNIEKCPSILYYNVRAIKQNYEFLKDKKVNVENCLHVLNTGPNKLKETYGYIINNYGEKYISRNTSILSVSVSRIKEIEDNFSLILENELILTACISNKNINEIKEIIEVCKENNIKITGSVFLKTANEIEKIIMLCKENNIKISGSIFLKSSKQLKENIEYIKTNFGEEYLTNLIVSKNIKNLQKHYHI